MDTGTNCKFKNYFPSSMEWFKILVSQRSSQRALNPMIQVPKWPANRYNEGKLKLCIFPGKQKTAHFWHNWEAWKIDTYLPNFLGPRARLITIFKMFLLPSFGLLNLEFQITLCAWKGIFFSIFSPLSQSIDIIFRHLRLLVSELPADDQPINPWMASLILHHL